jgi:hypothetical protein
VFCFFQSDEDKEDLIRINQELAHIRLETHAAFLTEDEEMVRFHGKKIFLGESKSYILVPYFPAHKITDKIHR